MISEIDKEISEIDKIANGRENLGRFVVLCL